MTGLAAHVTHDAGYLIGTALFLGLAALIMFVGGAARLAKVSDRASARAFDQHVRGLRPLGVLVVPVARGRR